MKDGRLYPIAIRIRNVHEKEAVPLLLPRGSSAAAGGGGGSALPSFLGDAGLAGMAAALNTSVLTVWNVAEKCVKSFFHLSCALIGRYTTTPAINGMRPRPNPGVQQLLLLPHAVNT